MFRIFSNNKSDTNSNFNSNSGIFENRDLRMDGPINSFLVNEKYYDIVIDLNDREKSINQRLIDELNKKLSNEESNHTNIQLTLENTAVSRSKNYVLTLREQLDDWEWHSWNALTKQKEESEKNFFLFAIKIFEDKYACILFKRSVFNEFLKKKKITSDNRYFFYFAKRKN